MARTKNQKIKIFNYILIVLLLTISLYMISFLRNEDNSTFDHAKAAIAEKSAGVAKQIDIYLEFNKDKTLEEIQADPLFQEIAVQSVGKTGYTAVTDYNTLVVVAHKNKNLVGVDLHTLAEKLPGFWSVMFPTKGGNSASGTYLWLEEDSTTSKKYMFITTVERTTSDGVNLHVAATTYLDEYE